MSRSLRKKHLKDNWNFYFYYDELSPSCLCWATDRFTGKDQKSKIISKGDFAGTLDNNGYWRVEVKYNRIQVHKIVWELHAGEIESGYIVDHIDGDKSNNCISNLRVIPKKLNSRNRKMAVTNTSGVVGVHRFTTSSGNSYFSSRYTCCITGKRFSKTFNITKLGEALAFEMACNYRTQKIKEMNEIGAGYTDRHGKVEEKL